MDLHFRAPCTIIAISKEIAHNFSPLSYSKTPRSASFGGFYYSFEHFFARRAACGGVSVPRVILSLSKDLARLRKETVRANLPRSSTKLFRKRYLTDIKSKGFDKLSALRQGDPATRRDYISNISLLVRPCRASCEKKCSSEPSSCINGVVS